MVVELSGKKLISNADVMAPLVTKLSELEVEYEVTTNSDSDDNIVLWKRRVTERNVDSSAKVKTCVCITVYALL